MTDKNIRFHRVATKPTTGTVGHVYFSTSDGIIYVCTGSGTFDRFGENYSNRVTTIDSESTDNEYPSAKAVYSALSSKVGIVSGATEGNIAVFNSNGGIKDGGKTIATIENRIKAIEDELDGIETLLASI